MRQPIHHPLCAPCPCLGAHRFWRGGTTPQHGRVAEAPQPRQPVDLAEGRDSSLLMGVLYSAGCVRGLPAKRQR
jgi:hypothetical protein